MKGHLAFIAAALLVYSGFMPAEAMLSEQHNAMDDCAKSAAAVESLCDTLGHNAPLCASTRASLSASCQGTADTEDIQNLHSGSPGRRLMGGCVGCTSESNGRPPAYNSNQVGGSPACQADSECKKYSSVASALQGTTMFKTLTDTMGSGKKTASCGCTLGVSGCSLGPVSTCLVDISGNTRTCISTCSFDSSFLPIIPTTYSCEFELSVTYKLLPDLKVEFTSYTTKWATGSSNACTRYNGV